VHWGQARAFSYPFNRRRTTKIVDDALSGDWSPDGRRITLSDGQKTVLIGFTSPASMVAENAAASFWLPDYAALVARQPKQSLWHQ